MPSLVALFESDDAESARKAGEAISGELASMHEGDAAALANVREVKPLEMSGALADHKVLIEMCNQEISFALTTQSLATQEGTYGTRAQASVHDENLVRVCHSDAKNLEKVFQKLIDWTVELNFGRGVPSPRGFFDLSSYATYEEVMQAADRGIPLSRDALYERYKLPRPKDENDVFIKAPPASPIALSDKEEGGVKENKKKLLKFV